MQTRSLGSRLLMASLLVALGCGSEDGVADNDGSGATNGTGAGSGLGGSGGLNVGGGAASGSGGSAASGSGGEGGAYCNTLTGMIRDFQSSHPDFEYAIGMDLGIVQQTLGANLKPLYAGNPTTPTTNGQQYFDQWYNDVDGVNLSKSLQITLTQVPGTNQWTYDSDAFFPIDGQLFGNEGNDHNFHFTFELHTKFDYLGGEVFTFRGDDDLWVFINGKLGIDLGGVHGAMTAQIDLDAQAAQLGISPGNAYTLDFFFAERHTSQSNFRIETTIGSFIDCGYQPT
jgi:fibro-slime domain-containing protein